MSNSDESSFASSQAGFLQNKHKPRKKPDDHKAWLPRQFRRDLESGFDRAIPVMTSLVETLIEATTSTFIVGPAAAIEFKGVTFRVPAHAAAQPAFANQEG